MPESIAFSPLFQWDPIIKGLLSGGLLAIGVLSQFGIPIQIVLFIVGILIFFDAVIPRDTDISILATVIAMFFSGGISVLSIVFSVDLYWVILLIIGTIINYYPLIRKK